MKTLRSMITILATMAMAVTASAGIKPSSPVGLEVALRDAAKLTVLHPELKALRVEGVSMLPYFGQDSVLVVKPTRSEALKLGMVVVYTSDFGDTVAHRIIGGDAVNGWVVKGYNNDRADSTRVTDANLVGTVYATLFASPDRPTILAASASPRTGDVPVALAGPAR